MELALTAPEVCRLLQDALKTGKTFAYPNDKESRYRLKEVRVDQLDPDLLLHLTIDCPSWGKTVVRRIVWNGPTSHYLLAQIPEVNIAQPQVPAKVYWCEEYLGSYSCGNHGIGEVTPVAYKDLEVGHLYIRVLGYEHGRSIPQLCRAARQISEDGGKERLVLVPTKEWDLYQDIAVAYLVCQRTNNNIRARGQLAPLIFTTTSSLGVYAKEASAVPYTPYVDIGKLDNGTRVALLDCVCQRCEFVKSHSDAGHFPHAPGGYNWGRFYPNPDCASYGHADKSWGWLWKDERVRLASTRLAEGPILATAHPPQLDYENGEFQRGAWIGVWQRGEKYMGLVQAVVARKQGALCYGDWWDALTGPCETIEQARSAALEMWQRSEAKDG